MRILSGLVLAAGLALAFYWFLLPSIAFEIARQAAIQRALDQGSNPGMGVMVDYARQNPTDRLCGVVFGFGLAWLGAFGLYATQQKEAFSQAALQAALAPPSE